MKVLNPLKAPFGKAKFSRVKNVSYRQWEDAFEVEFDDGLSFLEPHGTIRKANKISARAVVASVELEEELRHGFFVHYDNGQVGEVSWSFIRELPPKKQIAASSARAKARSPGIFCWIWTPGNLMRNREPVRKKRTHCPGKAQDCQKSGAALRRRQLRGLPAKPPPGASLGGFSATPRIESFRICRIRFGENLNNTLIRKKQKDMSTMIRPMTVAAPDLVLPRAPAAPEIQASREDASERSRLNLLRGFLWSFGVGVVAYLAAQAGVLARSHFQGFTPAAWLPLVVFSAGAAATVWHIRSSKRQSLVPARITSTPRQSDEAI